MRTRVLTSHLTSASSIAPQRIAIVVGAGDGIGSALVRRFAAEGYRVACARREGEKLAGLVQGLNGKAKGYSLDARKEDEVRSFFAQVEKDLNGEIDVVVHNIGGNVRFNLLETTERVYRKVWELCALSAFLVGREAASHMVKRGRGTIIFTGATASTRGATGFSAFAGGMHAKRALAQSMAREFGPKGIHVAHVVIDGPVQTAFIEKIIGEEAFKDAVENDGVLKPDHVADSFGNGRDLA
jgi:NAD(P)-dependent dehydrogenase (short-subunit alcohol dehydrogenase family)